jgi:hypothetical protein
MDEHQLRNPYQASVLRTDVNRALPSYIPEMLEESILAMQDALRPLQAAGMLFQFRQYLSNFKDLGSSRWMVRDPRVRRHDTFDRKNQQQGRLRIGIMSQ